MNLTGKFLILAGIIMVISGIIMVFGHNNGWLGKLPGDIFVKKDNFTFYFPITTSILISAVLSFFLFLFFRK